MKFWTAYRKQLSICISSLGEDDAQGYKQGDTAEQLIKDHLMNSYVIVRLKRVQK